MGDYKRTTRECTLDSMRPELRELRELRGKRL